MAKLNSLQNFIPYPTNVYQQYQQLIVFFLLLCYFWMLMSSLRLLTSCLSKQLYKRCSNILTCISEQIFIVSNSQSCQKCLGTKSFSVIWCKVQLKGHSFRFVQFYSINRRWIWIIGIIFSVVFHVSKNNLLV